MNMIARKMGALLAAASAGLVNAHGGSSLLGLEDAPPAYVPSSKNGGRKVRGNRHVQRAAAKAKNVRRFRRANKGRA